jgi:hypothetical protein
MKHTRTSASRQRGSTTGNLLFFVVIIAIGYMWKAGSSTNQVMGQSANALVAEYGQPVAKEQIARPS